MENGKVQILVVEDDLRLRSLLESHLRAFGFAVQSRPDGQGLERILQERATDLLVLDLGLPKEDGLQICQRIRRDSQIPILILTARNDELDRILGLEMGADDYLTKPFHPRELVARIQAILRRTRSSSMTTLEKSGEQIVGPFRLDRGRQEIFLHGKQLELSTSEYLTLAVLIEHEGQVLSREKLLWLTRQRSLDPEDRSVDMQVSRLRRLLGDDQREQRHIRTVWGRGYLFVAEP
ncbi:response regulator [Acidithiobacillus sp. CV18-2]|uniref:Response regulator n=1 Tax=Igneacidithiobacillus copahuensis TaxID=2724909 RepID=A0AAE2YNB8_9PROT|nr:response regulator [Igneacidithiobacillus copahuensis]MBU2753272.1 response regulator [Acidithiobacillus sp. CV18-3]MBU2757760.1 response regulator [Acidithiobacillus sp. BN09-2]MBU2778108.1 response regulator [Acidithiobacillus sp. CV18-2]MBU2797274.1 response regulator [Acidithiobacillus sp. VAN18-2]MBU2798235.1 response regulator [Acidithiobacillus sp. VAN18-4]UTV82045.1 response regulator [Acidithiobacillus sp. YTS05]